MTCKGCAHTPEGGSRTHRLSPQALGAIHCCGRTAPKSQNCNMMCQNPIIAIRICVHNPLSLVIRKHLGLIVVTAIPKVDVVSVLSVSSRNMQALAWVGRPVDLARLCGNCENLVGVVAMAIPNLDA